MDDINEQNLDNDYKRYLEIMQPYLDQLLDDNVIKICNAWIEKFSNCKENEKIIRNKYIFAMCYQLAKGVLEAPFLVGPTVGNLPPLTEEEHSAESSSELEYLIVDLENTRTKVLYDNEKSLYTSEYLSGDSDFGAHHKKLQQTGKDTNRNNFTFYDVINPLRKQNMECYNCASTMQCKDTELLNENYQKREYNVLMKLRKIKTQNLLLQKELQILKEQSIGQSKNNYNTISSQEDELKINNAINVSMLSKDSTTTLKSIKHKLKDVQESRNDLINKINDLKNNIDLVEIKTIEDFTDSERTEVKLSTPEEMKRVNITDNLNKLYEQSLKEIENNFLIEKQNLMTNYAIAISEKENIIKSKDMELIQLRKCIEDLQNDQNCKSSNVPDGDSNIINIKQKADELEKRLNKMEKAKSKCCKSYDAKLTNLQKEKHLLECSFHLELMRQRSQVFHELSDQHQTELATALNKLENKYKEIVANVQSTAIQRRMHDQMALESIIQAVCGVRNEGTYTNSAQATCPSQLTNKATRNQRRDGRGNCDAEIPAVLPGNKLGSVIAANKSFGDESVQNDYCLDSEKFTQLLEKLYIPQRDTGGDSSKK